VGSLAVELLGVQFQDTARGWVVGQGGGLRTTDEGASWIQLPLTVCGR
jgi:photosystem II stability/assembly factor-like uncharacterized protein